MTRGDARALMRLLMQDTARMQDGTCNDIINDAYTAYRRENNRWQSWLDGSGMQWSVSTGSKTATPSSPTAANQHQFVVEVLGVHRQAANNEIGGPEMERLEFDDIVRLQNDSPTNGVPSRFYAHRYDRDSAFNDGAPIIWRLWIWPPADGSYHFSARVLTRADLLASDGRLLELPEDEAHLVARNAAILGARIMGRSNEFVEGIRLSIPDRQEQGRVNQALAVGRPRGVVDEVTV